MKQKSIGLALGSGGVKGLAHIGALRILEQNNIKIDYIAGSSIGALVGAYYALHENVNEIEKIALEDKKGKFWAILEPSFSQGLVKGIKIEKMLDLWFGDKEFKDTKIPLCIVATDILTGEKITFKTGKIATAVRASISIPGLFKPVQFGEKWLVDGGLCDPVPVSEVRNLGAKFVVGINLDNYQKNRWLKNDKASMASITIAGIDVLRHYLGKYSSALADVVVEPSFHDPDYRIWSKFFTQNTGQHIIKEGEQAMAEKIGEILKKI